jgi:phosphate starvation-inducible PhoH-like protein
LHDARLIRRHTLSPPDNRRLAHLCGPLDGHLRNIEAALGVTLTRRDESFRIDGPRAAVERTSALLDALYAAAATPISEAALQMALAQAGAGAGSSAPGLAPAADATDATAAAQAAPVVLHTRHADLSGRTPNQTLYLRQMLAHDITFGIGPAGTGKTFLAVACAVDALQRQGVQRIVLTRPAVEAGERLGFLPGDLKEKVDPYLRPLYDALFDVLGDQAARLMELGVIEVAPLAFMRGRTLTRAFVILDEAQNTTGAQMKMALTRLGEDSHMVVTGDPSQSDLPGGEASGLNEALSILDGVDGVGVARFGEGDVVRHPLVARIVAAYTRRGKS